MLPTVCVCVKLRRSANAVTALYDEALRPIRLTTPQFGLLRTMKRLGPITLSALADARGLDRTTLNRALRLLEDAGLIHSAPGKDQRMRIVTLTDSGLVAVVEGEPLWEGAQDRMAEILGKDRDQLFTILDRIEELRA